MMQIPSHAMLRPLLLALLFLVTHALPVPAEAQKPVQRKAVARVGTPYAGESDSRGNDIAARKAACIRGFGDGFDNVVNRRFDSDAKRVRRAGKSLALDLSAAVHQGDMRFCSAAVHAQK